MKDVFYVVVIFIIAVAIDKPHLLGAFAANVQLGYIQKIGESE